VERGTERRHDLLVRHLAEAVVREVELLATHPEHAPPDQLVHPRRRLVVRQPRRLAQQREVERPPDDGGHRRQPVARLAESREAPGRQIAHARR